MIKLLFVTVNTYDFSKSNQNLIFGGCTKNRVFYYFLPFSVGVNGTMERNHLGVLDTHLVHV